MHRTKMASYKHVKAGFPYALVHVNLFPPYCPQFRSLLSLSFRLLLTRHLAKIWLRRQDYAKITAGSKYCVAIKGH